MEYKSDRWDNTTDPVLHSIKQSEQDLGSSLKRARQMARAIAHAQNTLTDLHTQHIQHPFVMHSNQIRRHEKQLQTCAHYLALIRTTVTGLIVLLGMASNRLRAGKKYERVHVGPSLN